MGRSVRIRERKKLQAIQKLQKSFVVIKGDRNLQVIIAVLIAGAILLSLSEYDIQPYITKTTFQDNLYSYQIERNGLSYPNDKLNIYAMAPNYPIYITIDDSQHLTLDYNVYLVNDTGQAIGYGPSTFLFGGQITNTTNLVINNTIYHMTYRLTVSAPGLSSFNIPVTVTQTETLIPPANYWILIPGVILMLAGMVSIGMKMMSISSDVEKYYSKLNLKNKRDIDIISVRRYSSLSKQTSYENFLSIVIGLSICALGFVVFGHQFLLSWIGIILVIAGISLFLNGLIRLSTRG